MVDYNIGIPQQQLYQAPDPMQNFLRMQQLEQAQTQTVGLNKLREMQTRGLAQDQQLTALKMQATRQEMATAAAARARAIADQNALLGAIRGSVVGDNGPQMPDLTTAANRLVATGNLGPAATALSAANAFTDTEKKKVDLSKVNSEVVDKDLATFRTFAPTVRTPQDAGLFAAAMFDHPSIGKLMSHMGLSREQAVAKAQQDYAADPQRWTTSQVGLSGQQVVDTLKQKQTPTDLGGQISTQNYDAFGRPVGAPTEQTKTLTPKEEAGIETPAQKLAYQADLQKQKARVDLEISQPVAKVAVDTSLGDIDAQIARAKNLKAHKGLGYITGGIMGRIGSTREDATSAQADLDQIIAKAGFEALQQMRNASPTGGALGNVSDTEGKRLEASAAALAQSQGKTAFREKLDRYIADLERAKKSVKNSFDAQYAGIKSAPAKSDGWTIEEN